MSIKRFFPDTRPSLDLNFAATKRLDPRITYTRASTGTFVGSNGLIQSAASGAARFDHNPLTGESLGLLVEEARTNLNLNSAATYNGLTNITSNSFLAPDGTLTAATFQPPANSNSGGTHELYGVYPNVGTISVGNTVTVYARRNSGSAMKYLVLRLLTSGYINYYNLETGVVTVDDGSMPGSMTNVGNGWWRCQLTNNISGGSTPLLRTFVSTVLSIAPQTNGDPIYLWGVQNEAGSFPTSYIPTTTATVTRAADVATLANTGSSIFPISAFTTVNTPFGTAGGGSTVKLVGPTIKRTAIYAGDLPQAQINTLTNTGDFWRWRVLGSTFALPNFTTNGSVTVDWGDGVVETLTTAVHTFTNGGGYHDIGFRLNSGTFFRPNINNNATYKDRVIAIGPAPASMRIDANLGFYGCSALKAFDATIDALDVSNAWLGCSSLTSFPLVNTTGCLNFVNTWSGCSSLTSFSLINAAACTGFQNAWRDCSGLTSFPLINVAAGIDFFGAWENCSSLVSFPAINPIAGTNFTRAWNGCNNLATFPANMFNTTGTLVATAFTSTFTGCALTATSIENILTSLVTNGQSNITLGLNGGTNAGAAAWTANAIAAYSTLISRGWTITRNA